MKLFFPALLLTSALLCSGYNSFSQATVGGDEICASKILDVGLACQSFTNSGSTASSLLGTPACWATAPSNDVWFSFVATVPDMSVSTDVVLFDPFNTGGNLTDTEIAVYKTSDGTCTGTPTLIGCDEDNGINSLLQATTLLSIVEVTGLIPGDTYFIRLDGNGTAVGAFCISVADTYTPGSKPCEAHIVHPNSLACDTLNGNKVNNATSSNTTKVNTVAAGTYLPLGQDYCGADDETAQYGTWTTFIGNSSDGAIQITNYAPTAVDYTLFSGNCVNMVCIGSQQVAPGGNTTFSGIVIGTEYFVLTTLTNGATTDAVTTDLCISSVDACVHPSTDKNDGTGGSVNTDDCENAYGITVDQVYSASTYCSTPDQPGDCNTGNNIWFYWDVPADYPAGPVFFQVWNKNCTGGPGNHGIRVFPNPSTSCGTGCVDATSPKSDRSTNVGWDSGFSTRYYLNFTGAGDASCDFNFMAGSLPILNGIKVDDVTLCLGESTLLKAFGGYEYAWSTNETGASIVVAPTVTTSYTVTAIKGASGSDVATVTVVPQGSCPTGPICAKTYDNSGTFTWTAPACVTEAVVECWGAGGAGGGTGGNGGFNAIGGGGGGGAYTKATVPVVPGTNYEVYIGAQAPGGSGNGRDGENTTFKDDLGVILIEAQGGKGGEFDTGVPGAGGIGTYNGGAGSAGDPGSGAAGGGGGGAGADGNGDAAASGGGSGPGGAGGPGGLVGPGGGDGGAGGSGDGTNGTDGSALGGGGGGSDGGFSAPTTLGGNGAIGRVTITCVPSSATITVNDVTICSGETASLIASGGDSYSWDAGASTTNPYDVSPTITTSYTVTGTSNGCSGEAVATVTVNPGITVTVNDASICAGQSATLTASGADSYAWSDGSSVNPLVVSPAATETYTVTGTTSGCTATAEATVTIGGNLSITVNDETICSGGSATLTATGADSYSWTSGETVNPISVSPTVTTTYTVTGNSSGCTGEAIATVTVSADDDASFSYSPSTVCKTGGTDPTPVITGLTGGTFTVTGGITIDPNTGVIDLASTPIASYTVTYSTAGPCPASSDYVVSIVNVPDATFSYGGPYCQSEANPSPSFPTGASAGIFSASPAGLSFISTGTGEIDLTTSAANTYTVTNTIAAGGGCAASTQTYTVTVNAGPTTDVDNQSACAGSPATLTASGATSYVWSDASTAPTLTASPTITTSYTVTGTTGGCSSSAVGTITVNASPTVTVNDAAVCDGLPATLTANGATNYSWSTGSTQSSITASPGTTTSYTVTGTTAGCSATAIGTITLNASPDITVNSPTICQGNTTSLTANGGSTYSWSTGSTLNPITVSPTSTTSYTVTGNSNGCTATAVATVTVNQLPVMTVNSVAICAGETATLIGSGGSTYSWSTGASGASISVSPTSTTSYTVADNTPGCSASAISTVTVTTPPTVTVNSESICEGQSATLTASGASTYSWSNNLNSNPLTVNPILTQDYTVTGNPGGCPGTAISKVLVYPLPPVGIASAETICLGEAGTLRADGALTYVWSDGSTADTLRVTPTALITQYSVTGTDINGCEKTANNFIFVNSGPIANPGNDITILYPASTTLLAEGGASYSWTPAEGLSCIDCASPIASPTVTTTYCVKVADADNCIDSACVTITVEIPCPTNDSLEVPNAFSPNNDGHNDFLVLHGWDECIVEFTFAVFDRWGEKVFESENPLQPWDGTFKGKPLDPAVFVYFLEARFKDKKTLSKKGNITLIR